MRTGAVRLFRARYKGERRIPLFVYGVLRGGICLLFHGVGDGAFVFVEPYVERNVFHAFKVGVCHLDGAETGPFAFLKRLHLAAQNEPFQFLNAVTIDVFVCVVVPLAAEGLKHEA